MTVIDEKEPLEAVHKETGRTVPMTFKEWGVGLHSGKRWFSTLECPDRATSNHDWFDDGGDMCEHNKWFIRNVQAAPALPADWAIESALKRIVWGGRWNIDEVKRKPGGFPALLELARMIEKHEEAPDPLAADRAFVANMEEATGALVTYPDRFRNGANDDLVRKVMAYLRANVDKITGSA